MAPSAAPAPTSVWSSSMKRTTFRFWEISFITAFSHRRHHLTEAAAGDLGRNAAQLPAGGVLVVGSGQSGCQVVEDLLGEGRDVHLCVGKAGRLPRRYRGREILEWLRDTGLFKMQSEH